MDGVCKYVSMAQYEQCFQTKADPIEAPLVKRVLSVMHVVASTENNKSDIK